MQTTTKIEAISPTGIVDMLQHVHAARLLESCSLVSDTWADGVIAPPSGDGLLPEPNTGPKLELPWASECWGRVLASYCGWDDSAWSVEESGVLIAPVYLDRDTQQAQLVKATLATPECSQPKDCWCWVAELKAHCHILKVARGVLHICHAANDHEDAPALAMAYEFEFTTQEIESLWQLLLTLRKSYRPPRPSLVPAGSDRA